MFSYSSIAQLPNISKLDIKIVKYMGYLLNYFDNLLEIPNISTWNTSNVINMCRMFYGCSRLLYIPDISKWNAENVQSMFSTFAECSSLSCLFDISNWNLNNLINVSCEFKNRVYFVSIPKINSAKEADITDFIKGYASLKSLDFLPKNIKNINEELNIINNNFFLLTEPTRKEIYKIVYDKVFYSLRIVLPHINALS